MHHGEYLLLSEAMQEAQYGSQDGCVRIDYIRTVLCVVHVNHRINRKYCSRNHEYKLF